MTPGTPLRWLGGQIDVHVRMETGLTPEGSAVWDVAEWDVDVWSSVDLAYQDVSEYVEEVAYRRGSERWDQRFTAGTATVVLDNTDGLFTPISDAPQPWGVPFRPGRKVQISVIPDPDAPLTRVVLFTGRIDDRVDDYEESGADLTTTIQIIDVLAELGANNPPALETATGVQTTSARVHEALDYGQIPADVRDIQTGVHTMQTSFLAQSTLEECQRAADAEGGAFFADPDGNLVFKARDWLISDTRSTVVQGYLGFASPPPGIPAHDVASGSIKTSESLGRVRNDVQFARDGGTLQWVFDTDSIAVHGIRSYRRTDLHNNDDAEVLTLAERNLAAYAESRLRVEEVGIVANDDPDNDGLNSLFYETEMGDRLALEIVTLHGWTIPPTETHVIGIAGRITPDDWTVTFVLDDSLIAAAGMEI